MTAAAITKAAGGNEDLSGALGDFAITGPQITSGLLKKPESLIAIIRRTADGIVLIITGEKISGELNEKDNKLTEGGSEINNSNPFSNSRVKPEVLNIDELETKILLFLS